MRAGSRVAFPRWAPLELSDGVVTLHREVLPGVYVGGARVPSRGWFPEPPRELLVIDLREPGEPLPERVGPDGAECPDLDDLRDRDGVRFEAHPLAQGPGGVPGDGDAYRRAVAAALSAWPRSQVLFASREGAFRAPLVAYGLLRLLEFSTAAAFDRVGLMVGDPVAQVPTLDARAWAELRLLESDEGQRP